jgi:hypothetical protein
MKVYDLLFNKEDYLAFHYGHAAKYIQHLRQDFLDNGGDPLDFPAFLEEAGVKMQGSFAVIEDKFEMMAILKFGNKEHA